MQCVQSKCKSERTCVPLSKNKIVFSTVHKKKTKLIYKRRIQDPNPKLNNYLGIKGLVEW